MALVPIVIPNLAKAGIEVIVEAGAGVAAGFPDAEYAAKGAKIIADRAQVFAPADIIVQMLCYGSNDQTGRDDLPLFRRNQVLIGFLRPIGSLDHGSRDRGCRRDFLFRGIDAPDDPGAEHGRAFFHGHDLRLQSRADRRRHACRKFSPMLTTAAGTITPARVLVIGAGVAGLQAIATARRLGAVVSAYDLRPAAKEQVQSLGARFVELPIEAKDAQDASGYAKAQDEDFYRKQRELLGKVVARERRRHHRRGRSGKEIAGAGDGGNGQGHGAGFRDRRSGRRARRQLRTVQGRRENRRRRRDRSSDYFNFASTVPHHASQMYARNIAAFLNLLVKDGKLQLNLEDDIIREHAADEGRGNRSSPRPRIFLPCPPLVAAQKETA